MKTLAEFQSKFDRRELTPSDFHAAYAILGRMWDETAEYFKARSDEFNKPQRAGSRISAAVGNAAKVAGIERSLPTGDTA